MSIRIHELAKKIDMDNKSLLALLKERNFDVKTASSTIDNISAEALVEEFAKPAETEAPVEAETPKAAPAPEVVEDKPAQTSQVRLPAGVFVKSPADIAREKEEAAKALEAEKAAARAPAPVPPPPSAPVPPRPAAPAPTAPKPVSIPPPPPRAPAPPPPVSRPAPAAVPPSPPRAASAPSAPALPTKGPAPTPVASSAEKPAAAPAPAADGEIATIQVKPPIIVREFAQLLGLKPFKLISELMEQGVFASMNQTIDEAVAIDLAAKHDIVLEVKHRGEGQTPGQQQPTKKDIAKQKEKAAEEDEANLEPRPPVVCILGHVDHGKTSLLDTIRKANVVSGEAGGITQHIGAYQVSNDNGKISFLDTPGHAAFNKMRARGAQVTDIAILVIAADDGFKPQTDEALKYIKDAGVALIVAINKMDAKGANIDQVKTQMQQRDIASEDWGGETITVPVSALKGDGIDTLLEMIQLQAEVLELRANPQAKASGVIIESQLEVGRGPLATVIVQRGTLRVGDAIVCGKEWAKVRAMFDDQGKNVKEAPPSTPVRVIGWSGTPESGSTFTTVKNARAAEDMAEEEADKQKGQVTSKAAEPKEVSVEALFANIAATQAKTLKLVIKSDVYGSAEAVRGMLEAIQSEKVSVEIVANEVGLVTKNDVQRASAAGATILAFNTKLENGVTPQAKHHGVRIESFKIIYELVDATRDMMADMLDPDLKEVKLGAVEVREVFPLAKGFVAGCLVTEGKIIRNAMARLRRGKETVHEGKVQTLKRFKDDANEIRAGLECGIKLDDFNGYEKGDVIETFEVQKVRASL
ncbi:translation initiation factor IF-2 [Synoicihabitans lomoniglobus]|uniref:Translation initiation factor IF-2 n=1 Tax=Synoicihabitans lomoniglobus TaxID=2909285 RepID=A0AAF0CRI3_9BACT|nr:translation initiation factor IF-2 [Opitutaceae bacterium LMO-M01]WED66712.1 translation initiation factor IF-2 [Opitutaceae bacterium LMO-M01]